ncbi:hypothetical protein DFP93_12740 [Aneurinibacillus soli]|nr:hypothetical protein [Aneurinibacillus soli]PYE57933.1 hypothetical protein DFP93_12740 [Aneurinibacillus soli]
MMKKKMCCFCLQISLGFEGGEWICPSCGKDITPLAFVEENQEFTSEYIQSIMVYKEKVYSE